MLMHVYLFDLHKQKFKLNLNMHVMYLWVRSTYACNGCVRVRSVCLMRRGMTHRHRMWAVQRYKNASIMCISRQLVKLPLHYYLYDEPWWLPWPDETMNEKLYFMGELLCCCMHECTFLAFALYFPLYFQFFPRCPVTTPSFTHIPSPSLPPATVIWSLFAVSLYKCSKRDWLS